MGGVHTWHVGNGWGQILSSLPFEWYSCYTVSEDSGVQHPTILQEMVCSLLSFALFLTDRFPHQQMIPKVMTLLTKES